MKQRLDKLVKAAVGALEDIKARDIVVLDVTPMTPLFDRMIVASADSARQTKALANSVLEKMKALGCRAHGMEGGQAAEWILVDLGEIVVHIMQPAVRQHYNLEELWGGVPAEKPKRRRAAPSGRKPGARARAPLGV